MKAINNQTEKLFGEKEVWIKNVRNGISVMSRKFKMVSFGGAGSIKAEFTARLLETGEKAYGEDIHGNLIIATVSQDGELILNKPIDRIPMNMLKAIREVIKTLKHEQKEKGAELNALISNSQKSEEFAHTHGYIRGLDFAKKLLKNLQLNTAFIKKDFFEIKTVTAEITTIANVHSDILDRLQGIEDYIYNDDNSPERVTIYYPDTIKAILDDPEDDTNKSTKSKLKDLYQKCRHSKFLILLKTSN